MSSSKKEFSKIFNKKSQVSMTISIKELIPFGKKVDSVYFNVEK